MATITWNATVDDLYKVDSKAELVDGELLIMPAGGRWHGTASKNILISLDAHVRRLGVGMALGDNVGFLCDLPNRRSFSPDCAYYTGPDSGVDFLPRAPVFAVEVRSKEDYGSGADRRIARKRADYFTAGTQVVWDVDIDANEIRVYRATNPEKPTVYGSGTLAEAEPAVPGWTFAVDELLA
ncbi:MAG TPA: Uma2 family endonuclease [Pirellulales bacterium]|nr:Uma2 family endonuclease [Pirellulales bacterium]